MASLYWERFRARRISRSTSGPSERTTGGRYLFGHAVPGPKSVKSGSNTPPPPSHTRDTRAFRLTQPVTTTLTLWALNRNTTSEMHVSFRCECARGSPWHHLRILGWPLWRL